MKKTTWLILTLPLIILFVLGIFYFINKNADQREEIVITMPFNEYIRSIDTNYYKLWLEEQTGLSIRFNIIQDAPSADYLRSMFASGYVESDALFSVFSGEDWNDWSVVLQEFGEKGYILPLNDYIGQDTHLNAIFEDYSEYNLRSVMTSKDGNIYYVPGFDPSISESHFQVMWLNQKWLKTLNLKIPQTVDEFRDVLYAFKTQDPNGNGKQDEIPLAGSRGVPSEQFCNFIINAFIYNDPSNSRMFLGNGVIRFAPVTDEWREAMKYLNGLYKDGLIDPYAYGHNTLVGLANSPWNILGGFASTTGQTTAATGPAEAADPVSQWVNPFTDVTRDDWFYNGVAYANYHGLMIGYGGGIFAPNDVMSAAMFATVLWNMEGRPMPTGVSLLPTVSPDAWYYIPVLWAVESGLLDAAGLMPETAVSRQAMAVMMVNYARMKGYNLPKTREMHVYSDYNQIAPWALPSVVILTEAGVMSGNNGSFNPERSSTRAEAAQVFMDFRKRIVLDDQ